MKKILYVNPVSSISGAENSLLSLITRIYPGRFQPFLVSREKGPLPDLCKASGIPTFFIASLPRPGVSPIYTIISMPYNALRIAYLINQSGIDLVHCNSVRSAYSGGLGARLAGVPSIIHVRDYHDSPFRSVAKAHLLDFLSDRILVVSKAVEKTLLGWAGFLKKKVQVVYNGIEKPAPVDPTLVTALRRKWSQGNDEPVFGVIGMINRLKGQDIALEAFMHVVKRYPRASLVFVGEARGKENEQFLSELLSRIETSGLNDRVIFAGFREDIPVVLNSIDILLHPAMLPDALPRVLLEACTHSVLVIASDIGGIGEIIMDGETGRLVEPGNPEALATAILESLGNPQKCINLKERGKEFVDNHFSINQYVETVLSIYQEIFN